MSYTRQIKDGFITVCETQFNCPVCGHMYEETFYEAQLAKSKRGFIFKKCGNCQTGLGITTDIKGDVRVWVKGTITDGFRGYWSEICPTCGKKSMQVVRPGKVQCKYCG